MGRMGLISVISRFPNRKKHIPLAPEWLDPLWVHRSFRAYLDELMDCRVSTWSSKVCFLPGSRCSRSPRLRYWKSLGPRLAKWHLFIWQQNIAWQSQIKAIWHTHSSQEAGQFPEILLVVHLVYKSGCGCFSPPGCLLGSKVRPCTSVHLHKWLQHLGKARQRHHAQWLLSRACHIPKAWIRCKRKHKVKPESPIGCALQRTAWGPKACFAKCCQSGKAGLFFFSATCFNQFWTVALARCVSKKCSQRWSLASSLSIFSSFCAWTIRTFTTWTSLTASQNVLKIR